ncbi:unnamed protein product [Staurois parvus]|uniref:Uncharacterized protein n=1 Tax=Staurois parvus TaxID=386267 RepID=A0ABN9FJ62_9NEOB|nr:unnamed protein product [Staurois parvus]
MALYIIVNVLKCIRWAMGSQWKDCQRGMEASGGIGREGWRTLSGGQWRDWLREWWDWVEDTEWRPVVGLVERDGGH